MMSSLVNSKSRFSIPGYLVGPFLILIVAMIYGSLGSEYFLQPSSIVFNTGRYIEIGLLALALTFVIINGDIDLSVASTLAASAGVLAKLFESGVPIVWCCVASVFTGFILGLLNGLIVIKFGLPSLVVTLATLALYRGLTQVMLGDGVVADYPESFVGFDQRLVIGGSPGLPAPLALFIVASIIFYYILHRSNYGLKNIMSGSNPSSSNFSGISVNNVRLIAFALSGTVAGVCAVMITSRLGSTISNVGLGLELLAITAVVLGGTDIFGGRGAISGTVVALFAIMAVREALVIQDINGQVQDAAIGLLLILTVLVPRIRSYYVEQRNRKKRFNESQTRT
ncbi:ABC transporter permease [Candidatus Planktophila dulcis]|uniref:ABC transporter permease n=1 Tax=Candidatus Planktophila dulcis TaxID=1884914 RepID=UPI003BEF1984